MLAFEVPDKPRPAFKSKIVKEDLVDSTWLNGDKPKPVQMSKNESSKPNGAFVEEKEKDFGIPDPWKTQQTQNI